MKMYCLDQNRLQTHIYFWFVLNNRDSSPRDLCIKSLKQSTPPPPPWRRRGRRILIRQYLTTQSKFCSFFKQAAILYIHACAHDKYVFKPSVQCAESYSKNRGPLNRTVIQNNGKICLHCASTAPPPRPCKNLSSWYSAYLIELIPNIII